MGSQGKVELEGWSGSQ